MYLKIMTSTIQSVNVVVDTTGLTFKCCILLLAILIIVHIPLILDVLLVIVISIHN